MGRADCERENVPLVDIYRDDDRSASQYAQRPREDWERLVEDLRTKAQPGDRLWGWEISRLTRDREIWAKLIRVCQDQGMFLWVGGKLYDTQNPQDLFFLDILMAKAVAEVGDGRARILRNVRSQAEAGKPTGFPPYGYRHVYDPDTGVFTERVPDPTTAPIVAEMADRVLAGEGYNTIARDLNARLIPNSAGHVAGQELDSGKWSKGWTAATIRSMLARSSTMGKRSWKGRLIEEGGWEGIVSEEDWYAIQKILKRNSDGESKDGKATYLLSGIATCGAMVERDGQVVRCGCRVYGGVERKTAKRVRRRVYRCRGRFAGDGTGHVSRKASLLEEHVVGSLMEHFSRPDVRAGLLAGDDGGDVAQARVQLAKLERELEELYADVRARKVSRALAAADEEGIQAEIAQLRERVRPRPKDSLMVALAEDPVRVWEAWTVEQKRKALRVVAERIDVLAVGLVGRRRVSVDESVDVVWRRA